MLFEILFLLFDIGINEIVLVIVVDIILSNV